MMFLDLSEEAKDIANIVADTAYAVEAATAKFEDNIKAS